MGYRYGSGFEYILPTVITLSVVFFAIFFLIGTGKIEITKNYYNEWQGAEDKLLDCQASKTPNCAPCVCKDSESGRIYTIVGLIFFLFGVGFWAINFSNHDKKAKKEEETKKKK